MLAALLLVPLAVAAFAALAWWRCGWRGCPDVDRLRSFQPGRATRLLDRNGRFFAELRAAQAETVPAQRIPRHVRDAFIAVEDQRFYEHGPVDWRRVAGAALHNLRRGAVSEGFSTITMQLARNVFPDRIPAERRTLGRKLVEIRVAYAIEGRYAKDEILEIYLSHIYFGNGARGIEAAARQYFGTGAESLTLSQGALLAALVRGPAVYDPRRHPERALARRNFILKAMEKQKRITPEVAARSRAAPLGVVPARPLAQPSSGLAPYFVEQVRRQVEDRVGDRAYEETLVVTTTLDLTLQRAAEAALASQLRAVESGALGRFPGPRYAAAAPPSPVTPYLQGAVVALQAATGDVLAWVGGRDFGQSRFDRVDAAHRQAGSAFKPFVYAAALRQGHTLGERIEDSPMSVRLPDGRRWQPRNFDGAFAGPVSVREALVESRNIPTLRLAADVGIGRVARVARDAGIRSPMEETPALPLGTVAVTPLEIATAYEAFATLGSVAEPRLVLSVRSEDGQRLWEADAPRARRALDRGVAFLVTDVLQEALDRGTGRTARAAGFAGIAAGKTGTTNDGTDAWFVGYTPLLVAAVWVGFDQPRAILPGASGSGSRLAAPVWGDMMARAVGPAGRWGIPDDVRQAWVDPASGAPLKEGCRPLADPPRREFFLDGRMPGRVCPARGDFFAHGTAR